MKRFLFAVAAVALVASVGSAEEKPATTPPATSTPAIAGAPVVESTPARRGLFSRLRHRSTHATGPVITPSPVPMPVVPAPKPMPSTKPTTGATTTPNGVIVASGTKGSGVVTTASYSEPAAPRRGLLGRRTR